MNSDDDDDMQDFLASASPAPRLLRLDMDGDRYPDVQPILFPPEAQLRLRSLNVSRCTSVDFWRSIVSRARSHLEELSGTRVGSIFEKRGCSILSLVSCYLGLTHPLNSDPRSELE